MKYRKSDVNVNVLINPGEDLLQLPLGRPQRVRHLPHRVRHPGRGAQQPRGVLPRGAPQYLPLFPLSHVQVKSRSQHVYSILSLSRIELSK